LPTIKGRVGWRVLPFGPRNPEGYQYTVLRHEKLCQTEMPAGQTQKVTKLPPTEAVFKGCAKELPACFKEVEEEYRRAAKYDAEHVFLVSDLAKLTKVYINAEETTTVTFSRLDGLMGIINKTIRKGVESDNFQHMSFHVRTLWLKAWKSQPELKRAADGKKADKEFEELFKRS